jgi:hypothetical protein
MFQPLANRSRFGGAPVPDTRESQKDFAKASGTHVRDSGNHSRFVIITDYSGVLTTISRP